MLELHVYSDITKLMEEYFEGLHFADTKILAKVFHPDAHYVNLFEGDYMNKSLSEYFEMLACRVPPADFDESRNEHIFSIEIGGEKMAFVKASMTMMNREYLDFLTLSYDQYGWRIMSKIFTYTTNFQEK